MLEEICKTRGIEVEHPIKEKREHLSVTAYKQAAKIKEAEQAIRSANDKVSKLNTEVETFEKAKRNLGKNLIDLQSKISGMEGIVLSYEQLEKIKPEPGIMGMIKGVTCDDVQNLKRSSYEGKKDKETFRDVSVKYVELKKRTPSPEQAAADARNRTRVVELEKENTNLKRVIKDAGLEVEKQRQSIRQFESQQG